MCVLFRVDCKMMLILITDSDSHTDLLSLDNFVLITLIQARNGLRNLLIYPTRLNRTFVNLKLIFTANLKLHLRQPSIDYRPTSTAVLFENHLSGLYSSYVHLEILNLK